MEQKTHCIVLKAIKYGDNRLIVDFLSREHGRLTGAWKVGASGKARARRQLFQPLTILEVDFRRSPRQQIAQIGDARIAEVYSSLPFDGVKMSLAFFIAEFLNYATRNTQTDHLLYDYVEQSLMWLDAAERGISNFHLMFMMHISRFLGFFPDLESYSDGALFDLREGHFCTIAPLHPDVLQADEAEKMLMLMRMSVQNMHLFRMSRQERNRIIDLALRFYRIHIPAFGDMHSLDVLRAL